MEGGSIAEEVDVLVMEEEKIVTSTWLSRHMAIPISTAKKLLRSYCKQKGEAVTVVWQVSGWLKEASTNSEGSQGEVSAHAQFQVSIAPAARLLDALSLYSGSPVPHVYSVHKSLPPDPALLCVAEKEQGESLLRLGQPGALTDSTTGTQQYNKYSAVKYIPHPSSKLPPPGGSVRADHSSGAKPAASPQPARPPQASAPGAGTNGHSGLPSVAPPKQREPPEHAKATATANKESSAKGVLNALPGPTAPEVKPGASSKGSGKQPPKNQHSRNQSTPPPRGNSNSTPATSSLASLWKKSSELSSEKGQSIPPSAPRHSQVDKRGAPEGPSATRRAEEGTGLGGGEAREDGKGAEGLGGGKEESSEGDDAAEFALLWAGEARGKGGSARRQGKRTKILDDDDEEEAASPSEEKVLGTLQDRTGLQVDGKEKSDHSVGPHDEGEAGINPSKPEDSKSSVEGAVTDIAWRDGNGGVEAGKGSEFQPGVSPEGEGRDLTDTAPAVASKALAPSTGIAAGAGMQQQGLSGKRKKVMRTVIDDKGRETTVIVWENADGSGDAAGAASTGGPPAVQSSTDPKQQPQPSNRASLHSSKGATSQGHDAPAHKAVPQKGKAAGKGAKGGQGSIASFFRKRS